ncbi:hypothetical protein WJX79_002907 [Trebouxia sp. C0005]
MLRGKTPAQGRARIYIWHRTLLQDCVQRTLLAASDVNQSFFAHLDKNVPAVCIVTVVGALSTAAGVGGGALFVPLFNSLLDFSIKDSAATSQAIITGGAIAGASFALFQTHPQRPDKSLIQFDLALLLIPSLLLGTSIGVILNHMIPVFAVATPLASHADDIVDVSWDLEINKTNGVVPCQPSISDTSAQPLKIRAETDSQPFTPFTPDASQTELGLEPSPRQHTRSSSGHVEALQASSSHSADDAVPLLSHDIDSGMPLTDTYGLNKSTPFSELELKMPGYTGYIQGLMETYAQTPIPAQLQTKQPPQSSFLFTRTYVPPVSTPSRDPCNFPDTYKPRHEPVNLWPQLQTKGKQDSAKPPKSSLALGDARINPFITSYRTEYAAPFAAGARIRSPLRNKMLADVADLKEIYSSAFQRVGDKRLSDMMTHMKERLAGKIGNANNNAFMLRKLFKMYDTAGSGYIGIEDFRVMTESFGMQLDDDSLLALFSRYDPQAAGVIDYQALMKELLHSDYYALYLGSVDNTQNTLDATSTHNMITNLKTQFAAQGSKLQQVLSKFDEQHTGSVSERSLLSASAACNILMSDKERDYVLSTLDPHASHSISIAQFLHNFCGQ